jgi:hypothetical protein
VLAIIFVENGESLLKKIFTSSSRVKILDFFLSHSKELYYPREIENITGVPYTAVRRELRNFEEIGLVLEKKEENHSYYCLNNDFFFLPEIKLIFQKVKRKVSLEKEMERLLSYILTLSPEKVILFKDLVKGKMSKNSEIGLLIVGEIKKKFWERVQELMEDLKPRKAVTLLYITAQEFRVLLDSGSSDFHQILKEGKVIYERKERESN